MGTYEIEHNYIDVIAQFSKSGTIMPMKIRVADEDGELHNFVIKGYRELEKQDGADWLSEHRFLIKLEIFGVNKTFTIIYNGKNSKWYIE